MSTSHVRRLAAAVAVLLLTVPALAVLGAGASESERAARGERLYLIHCKGCHGPAGGGDGPMTAVLKVRPPDLTRLAARRGGDFRFAEVRQYIDGRFEVPGHGPRRTGIFGNSLHGAWQKTIELNYK